MFSSSGVLIARASSSNVAEVAFEVETADTLTVAAVNLGTAEGSYAYRLFTSVTPDPFVIPPGDEGGALASGGVASGALTTGDMDIYTLAVTAGDEVRLKLGDLDGTSFFTPALEVFGADGAAIGSAQGSNIAEIAFEALQTETLTLVVRNVATNIGSYVYDLHTAIAPGSFVIPAGDEGGSLSSGGVVSGLLSLGDMDLYTLAVSAGDEVRLKLGDLDGTSFFTPAIDVFASDGTRVAGSTGSNIAEVLFQASASETLTVVVRNTATNTGVYAYDLFTAVARGPFAVPEGDEGGPLRSGGRASGKLTLADIDLYTLNVTTGDRIRLQLADPAGTSFFGPAIEVFDSGGARIANAGGSNIARVSFEAGTTERRPSRAPATRPPGQLGGRQVISTCGPMPGSSYSSPWASKPCAA